MHLGKIFTIANIGKNRSKQLDAIVILYQIKTHISKHLFTVLTQKFQNILLLMLCNYS